MPGSGSIELVLWLLVLPVGIVYSVWRRSKRSHGCAVCSTKTLPLHTPTGQHLVRMHYPDGVPMVHVTPPTPASRLAILGACVLVAFVVVLTSGALR